jgi:hypothetical protein
VYEARGWDRVGAHTYGFNTVSVSIAVIGDFTERIPTPGAIQAVKGMIRVGVERGVVTPDYKLYGHRDAIATSGPGNCLYKMIQRWPHYDDNKPEKPRK